MLEKKKDWHAYLYLAIPLILLTIFTFYPIIKTLWVSFLPDYLPLTDNVSFNFGISNYTILFNNPNFEQVMINTFLLVIVSVPLSVVLALIIAIALNSIKPLKSFFQTVYFLPYVTNTIAIGMVFSVIFNGNIGLLRAFGLEGNWIDGNASYFSKMMVLQLYVLWSSLAFKILIFLGGLQNIGKNYYDAAAVDGTSKFRVTMRITIPLLSPTILFISMTSFIGAFKSYDAIIGLFGENFQETRQMQTVVGLIYDYIGRGGLFYGRGAALAVILLGIILVFTLVQQFLAKKFVHY